MVEFFPHYTPLSFVTVTLSVVLVVLLFPLVSAMIRIMKIAAPTTQTHGSVYQVFVSVVVVLVVVLLVVLVPPPFPPVSWANEIVCISTNAIMVKMLNSLICNFMFKGFVIEYHNNSITKPKRVEPLGC
jgi:hypothetical protein